VFEAACPVDSIVLTDIDEYHFESGESGVVTKIDLLNLGDRYEGQIASARQQDSAYR
jgi:NADH-quinone oxidoreductase subunit I